MSATAIHEVLMPRVSDTMTEGVVARWLKAEGDPVVAGEPIAEMETDKATVELEAPAVGALLRQVVAAGEAIEPGGVVALVGPEGAELPARESEPAAAAAEETDAPAAAPTPAPAPERDGRVHASPLAKRVAAHAGMDLAALAPGSGPTGRILRQDVERAIESQAEGRPATEEPAPASTRAGQADVQELTRPQQVIARRMSEAKSTVPEFQVQTDVAMDAALALRAQLKEAAAEDEVAPSVNDLIVKASALALRRHPRVNGSYRDGRFELHRRVNVGIAVAAEEALMVPTIADTDSLSLSAIAAEARRLAARVRENTITAPELSGGTFTISNLGMFGMTAITPVINLPQAAILGVGAARAVLARDEDGKIVDRRVMTLTLTCDHRILYGADGARFLAAIRDLLEHPLRLV